MNKLIIVLYLSLLCSIAQAQLPIPEFQKGKATLSGTIANYDSNSNLNFRINIPNILMRTPETLFPTIEPNGSFEINIPLYNSTQIRMTIGHEDLVMLLSPDKKTDVAINLSNPIGKRFIFSGQYATINNEWCQPELIKRIPPVYLNGALLDSIADINANEFKKRCIDQYKQYVAHNNAQVQFSEDARTLANLTCAFDCLHNLETTHYCLQTAYQKKTNITVEQAFAAFSNINLPDNFYDYLKDFPVNHPLALYCYNYCQVLTQPYESHTSHLGLEKYLSANAPLTKEEQTVIHQYETAFKTGVPFQQGSDIIEIVVKYAKESDDYRWKTVSQFKKYLNHIMQDSTCLFIDFARTMYIRLKYHDLNPVSSRIEAMTSEITNPIFLGIIQDMNQQRQPRTKKKEKRVSICEVPQVSEEDLFATLIARHKGKVQFIDFWATWCSGCRKTIQEYEPLKKEISADKVTFVYLTPPSSIEKTWKILIEDIAGEHYWLNKKQWNYLWEHFQMTGLPMYLIIDKQGNIVKRFTHITTKELKELLEVEINKI